jgi:cyclopropane fatty-acyl-phospholipid synthase-like methyltransferase
VWQSFLAEHQAVRIVGVDTDAKAIDEGRRQYRGHDRIELRIHDAQSALPEATFDVVVALSAIEHVVDRLAFLKTVWSALKPGGRAYLNYDAGHFRSQDFKERLMVPVSQLLAMVGIEGPYMKVVNDELFCSQATQTGFKILDFRKHNISCVKRLMDQASDEVVESWGAFEERLNTFFSPAELDPFLWSSTLVVKKP